MTQKRSDSTHVKAKIMADAIRGINPPSTVSLDKSELAYWHAIVAARHTWTEVDLYHAANLASTLALIDKEKALLKGEDTVITAESGTKKVNPRITAIDTLTKSAISLSSKIQVHAAATMGESKLQRGKNVAKRDAIEAMEDADDDLIARPN